MELMLPARIWHLRNLRTGLKSTVSRPIGPGHQILQAHMILKTRGNLQIEDLKTINDTPLQFGVFWKCTCTVLIASNFWLTTVYMIINVRKARIEKVFSVQFLDKKPFIKSVFSFDLIFSQFRWPHVHYLDWTQPVYSLELPWFDLWVMTK